MGRRRECGPMTAAAKTTSACPNLWRALRLSIARLLIWIVRTLKL
jgi:hypothetical protein